MILGKGRENVAMWQLVDVDAGMVDLFWVLMLIVDCFKKCK